MTDLVFYSKILHCSRESGWQDDSGDGCDRGAFKTCG